jgi:N utilization substance protein B
MTRREARILAFSLIFEREFNSESTIEEIYECAKENREFEDNEYALSAFRGTQEHESEILSLVEENSQGWKINRISKISMSIIKLAVYEMLYTDIPLKVSINEAVELAKAYDDEKASSFVNGVLHSIAKKSEKNIDE